MKQQYTSFDQLPLSCDVSTVAAVLGISRGQAYEVFHRADFPKVCYGKRMLVFKADLLKWMEAQSSAK